MNPAQHFGKNDFRALSIMFLCIVGGIGLYVAFLAYSRGYGERFSKRTQSFRTMNEFRGAVGAPVTVYTNRDGTVTWDYTHSWTATAKVYFYTNGELYRVFTD